MVCTPKAQERRGQQRRKSRTGIKFPITDSLGCIVPFDRSRIADRRFSSSAPFVPAANTGPCISTQAASDHENIISMNTLPMALDRMCCFTIFGELIASVSNIYDSQSPGKWKELQIYHVPEGKYVCLEIWRTTETGKSDQYWLVTCDDLMSAREFFGKSALSSELFNNVL
jgi:hypothetical protein